jgi:preprotein translocase subunit SecE
MTEQTENKSGGWLDGLKLVAAIVLLVGGFYAYYTLTSLPTPVRYVIVFAGILLAAGSLALTVVGQTAWQFALSSRIELRKMVWPTVPEARTTTLIVFVFVTFLGIFFWVVDWLLALITRHLLGTGG